MTEALFRRGLSDRFLAALARLAEGPGWWTDVLADGNALRLRTAVLNRN
jgi:hypothetical protein